jgi:hypothetical protein
MREHWTCPSLLTAVCQLSSHQSNLTQHHLGSDHRLLNYVSSHRNPPQNQPLFLHGSLGLHRRQLPVPTKVRQCGWLLSWTRRPPTLPSQPTTDKVGKTNSPFSVPPARYNPTTLIYHHHNAPVHAFCQRILPVVVASVAETEYAAAFGGGQVLVELTLTLTNLAHPQQSPPLLFVDNECAIGLATS